MVFDSLSAPEQVEYLRDILPLKQFNEIEEEYDEFTDETVDDLLMAGKRNIKRAMDDWPDNWSILKEQIFVKAGKSIFDETSYRELSYYESAMNNGALETNLHLFEINALQSDGGESDLKIVKQMDGDELEDFLSDSDIEEFQKAFSTTGNNIWKSLDAVPKLRLGEVEDSDHVYLDFWVKNSEETKYHPREGRNITFPDIGKAFVRIHLDEEIAEIRERDLSESDITSVKSTIEELFDNELSFTGNEMTITDDDVRNFLELSDFVKATHAEHTGRSISKWTSKDEISEDEAYPEDRPHNFKNMVFDIDGVGRVTFQLSPANNAFRIYQKKLTPEDHRKTVEYIIKNING
ncbi:hypothetical protein [Haladaptatus halobius]|uniref:hypothetical protein n=1 Tax=Haladaptatus halobius TaxID=2884875 RepID=UPI001D0B501F|nr:hypothetical protein [Haladaptatus halobius]